MNREVLLASLREVEESLQDRDRQLIHLRKIQVERDDLYALTHHLRHVLGLDQYTPPPLSQPSSSGFVVSNVSEESLSDAAARTRLVAYPYPTVEVRKSSIWEIARDTLRQTPGADSSGLGLDHLVDAIRVHGYKLQGRSGRETLRSILAKKPEVFFKGEDSRWRLK